ncbi:MAG: glutamate--tRNA ligase [Candidatus Zixiibacteriota bacterium]
MPEAPVRVRIAPSPTGYLHVGTARTAIFNYLFARHFGGQFLVRIEDTDKERSDPALVEPILDALKWLGIAWDEELVYQSRRLDRYASTARQILDSGHGYRCFCTPEELNAAREKARAEKRTFHYNRHCLGLSETEIQERLTGGERFSIRLKIPDGETTFEDMVAGPITRQNTEIEDFIIARSDGSATYNLAVVCDDHDMGITHVIRGNDHITNTFKQIHLYRVLGWTLPEFGHVPLILRPDRKKVSKRLGDKDVNEYQREGILPEAMFNYLCLLGWSPKTDREVYSPQELIDLFDPRNFNPSNAIFDEGKLLAFNKEHIGRKSDDDLAVLVAPLLVDAGLSTKSRLETHREYLRSVIRLLKDRVRRLSDFVDMGGYFFRFDYAYDPKAVRKHFTPENAALLEELLKRFEALNVLTAQNAEEALNAVAEARGIKRAALIHATRLAVTGVPAGPGLFELLEVLSKQVVLERMRKAIEYIRSLGAVDE